MTRDWDLIRDILFDAEGEEKPDMSKYTDEQILYHTALLIDAGLVEGAVARGANGYPCAAQIIRLNWAGHDFLDSMRQDTIWNQTKTKLKEIGGGITFDLLKTMISLVLQAKCGLDVPENH